MIPVAKFTTFGRGRDVTHMVQSHCISTRLHYSVLPLCAADVQEVQGIEHVVSLAEFMTCDHPCLECVEDYKKRCQLGERAGT